MARVYYSQFALTMFVRVCRVWVKLVVPLSLSHYFCTTNSITCCSRHHLQFETKHVNIWRTFEFHTMQVSVPRISFRRTHFGICVRWCLLISLLCVGVRKRRIQKLLGKERRDRCADERFVPRPVLCYVVLIVSVSACGIVRRTRETCWCLGVSDDVLCNTLI